MRGSRECTNFRKQADDRKTCASHGGDAVGSSCGAVDGFDNGEAAAALDAVAGGGAILLDGFEKIFEDGLVATVIGNGGGGRALVFVKPGGFECGGSVLKMGSDNAVVFEGDGAGGAGDFDAAGVARVSGGGGVKNAKSAAGKFEDGGSGIFDFDFVKKGTDAGLHANDVAEQPEQQVNGVDALIDEGAAAVKSASAAPAGVGVILGRTIPLHASVHDDGPA